MISNNVTDAHTGYNVHREALNEAAVISGDQFHEPHALVSDFERRIKGIQGAPISMLIMSTLSRVFS